MTLPPDASTPAAAALPATEQAQRWTLFLHMDADRSGAVLGDRFEIGALIGVGGASWVYACKDRVLHNMAAIKILKDGSEDARRRFLAEGRILGSLRHPHLVQVLAIGETDTHEPFMVLELLPGRSLDLRLHEDGPLPWREVALLVAQAAAALDALHRAGVVHRDVKPSNIVQLSGATDQPLIKLIDVGVAKVEDWGRIQSGGFTPPIRHQTAEGLIVGTPGFQPPEVARVKPNPRLDIFALGVTIYVLCTGEMPDLLDPRRMNQVRPQCGAPPELEALVAAALAVDPEQRIASAAEIKQRLEAIRAAHANAPTPYLFDGCYELLEILGVGAKAEVYRAYHRDALRYVALKLPGARTRDDPEERVRFAREAQVLSVARHPALPALVECRTAPTRPQPYIAMALVRGKRASEYCVAPTCLAPVDVITVGQQLAGALAALHARGILHRDVHAANVLIDLGRETTATLIDVGMVEFTDLYYAAVDQRYPTPPEHRRKLGTGGLEHLEWTAPEARATGLWTAKCDVYSLGLLLYKLLTGKRPHGGNARELVSPRQFVPACPTALASALLAALHDDPAERVDIIGLITKLDAAADEMTEDRGSFVADQDVAAHASATPGPTRPRQPGMAALQPGAEPSGRAWARNTMIAAVAAVALALAWWIGGTTTRRMSSVDPAIPATVVDPQPRAPAVRSPVPMADDHPRVTTARPTVRQALDAAAVALRRCAGLAGGPLFLEFTAEGDTFTTVAAPGADEAVVQCVQDATTAIRFEPTPQRFFTEEYMP